jgi:hypothetical protein
MSRAGRRGDWERVDVELPAATPCREPRVPERRLCPWRSLFPSARLVHFVRLGLLTLYSHMCRLRLRNVQVKLPELARGRGHKQRNKGIPKRPRPNALIPVLGQTIRDPEVARSGSP